MGDNQRRASRRRSSLKLLPPGKRPRVPSCPNWLGEKGRREWDELAPELVARGLLDEANLMGFAALVSWITIMQDAHRRLVDNPADECARDMLRAAHSELRSWMAALGMTSVDTEADDDESA